MALAASLPIGRVADWAGSVAAHPVSVEPMAVDAAAADQLGGGLHRCAVAMPWEWRQANAFTEQDRLKVAARHMRSAALSGHFTGRYSDKVMRLFEERKPIDEQLWLQVNKERAAAMVDYQIAEMSRGQGGGKDPAQLFKTARAAEVVVCLRDYHTAEGCADILYASRLAGAPLNPAAAVA